MPMIIYILRHGDAVEQGYEDADRPLSSLGKEQTLTVAKALKALNVTLDAVLTSTLERAKQTGKIIEKELDIKKFSMTQYLIPGSDHLELIKQLNELSLDHLLLVGHEPHLSALLSLLVNGKTYAHIEIKKGSLALVEIPVPIEKGKGILRWLMNLELLTRIASSPAP
jgi:phosphohistidine phosphatase